jgi:hypothetical protein
MSERARVVVAAGGLALALLGIGWWMLDEPPREADAPERARERERALDEPTDAAERALGGELARVREPDPEQIAGRVIDADDGPLAEGSVLLECPDGTKLGRAAIDEEGWFEAPACEGSPTCVRLIHPGSVQPRAWKLDAGEAVELAVDPAPRLAGTVLGHGQAIGAARVIARRGDRRWTSGTDEEGSFMLPMAESNEGTSACDYEPRTDDRAIALLVLAPGYGPWTASVPASGDDTLNIELPAPAPPLTGTLRDPDGRGFDRARVLATSRDRPDEAHVAHPDAEGRFEFGELGEGVYELRANRDGIEVARGEGESGANVVMVGTLSARGPTLELALRDDRGEPMSGVRVDGGPFRAARTDAAGIVSATDVFAAMYDLRLRVPESDCGVSRERIEVPAGEQGPKIRVDLSLECEAD